MLSSMKIYPLLCVLAAAFISISASPIHVEVSAKTGVLINTETGAVLWQKNAHSPVYPSSTTKVFTALYALAKKGHALDEMITASYDAVCYVPPSARRVENSRHPPYRLEFGGTHMGLVTGETFPLRVLMYGLMLSSGNDAANVIAQHVSGSIPAFMDELNQFVREKGCLNTVLNAPHGLPHDNHITTAYDLAIATREALKIPFFREVIKTRQCVRPKSNKQPESMLYQHNALVKQGRFYYPKAIGGKTGYTLKGGYSLVTAAEDTERKLIVVLMGCEKIEQRYRDAIALFEAGFNEKKVSRTLFSKGFDLFTYPVEGANAPLQAYISDDIVLHYYPSEEPAFKTTVSWLVPPLPISAGQKVGDLQVFSQEGKILTSSPIFAAKSVEGTFRHQVNLAWQKVKRGMWDNVTLVMVLLGIIVLVGTVYYSHRSTKKLS